MSVTPGAQETFAMAAETAPTPATTLSPDVSIVIVNWRSKDYVRACLQSIAKEPCHDSYEIFVVDNDSADGCGAMLKDQFPHVRYVESATNLGFAGANNLAAAESRGRYILFLNPDTEICEGAIQSLSAALTAHPEAGMVGARLLNSDRTLQTTCVTAIPTILNQTLNLRWLRAAFPMWSIWGMQALFRAGKSPTSVQAISGACMMARREVVQQVGGFTTDYFMYAEDMDLCVKVARAGHSILYVPEAEIVHHAGGSSSQRQESHFSSIATRESLMHFFTLHRGRGYAAACRAFMALVCAVRLSVLTIATPVVLHPRGARWLRRTWAKWLSILAWCIGRTVFPQQMVNLR